MPNVSKMATAVETKTCRKCGKLKSITDFPRNKNRKDGHYSYCKDCVNISGRAWYHKNREKILEKEKNQRLVNAQQKSKEKLALNKTNKLSETIKAYLAAFIDADGTICIYKIKKGQRLTPCLSIGNTNFKALLKFQKWINTGKIYNHERINNKKHKKIYELKFTNYADIKKLLEQIIPYMVLKKDRARLLLEYCNLRIGLNNRSYQPRCFEIYNELKSLSKRGP